LHIPLGPTIEYREVRNEKNCIGSVSGQQPDGLGILKMQDGEIRFGNFKDGKLNGFVAIEYPETSETSFFAGNFDNGQASGNGTMSWKNGDSYVGHWQGGNRTGFGIFSWSNGNLYKGNFKSAKLNGGTFIWKDGQKYEGQFKDGFRSGFGTFYYADGEKYVGNWENGDKNGEGTLYKSDGTISYKGLWKNNQKQN